MSNFTIYNASAGSGKTYTLAVQYIARMIAAGQKGEGPYRHILAVTFTNKATAEMKDRILQQLYGISARLKDSDNYRKSVKAALAKMGVAMDDDDICREAGKLLHAILHDYSHFRVETIDSFFRGVLTDMARELDLTTGLKADIDSERVIGEAVDRIIARLNENDQVRKWVTDFVIEKIDDGRQWNVAKDIKDFARHLFDSDYLDCEESLTKFLCDDTSVEKLRDKLNDTQREKMAALEDAVNELEKVCANNDISTLKNCNYITGHIKKLRQAIDSQSAIEEPSKSILSFAECADNMLKAKHKPEDVVLAQEVHEALKPLIKIEIDVMNTLNTILLTRRHINPMRLLAIVGREVNIVAQERGAFLLANTPILLKKMVGDSDTSFIYEKTGSVLRHIMLDEFQDTSGLQWHNFQTLIKDNMGNGGSTLVVGDVKQSIYRWRGGDYSILANLPNEMTAYSPDALPLKENRRSTRRIIDFNNSLYLNIVDEINSLRTPDEISGWDIKSIYNDVEQIVPEGAKDGGCVQFAGIVESKDSDVHRASAEEMCDTIASLLAKGHKAEDMVILIRYSREMDLVAQCFTEKVKGVPLVSDDVFALSRSTAVSIIINALRVINHPDDRASLGRLVFLYNTEALGNKMTANQLFDGAERNAPFKSACPLLPDGFANIDRLRRMPIYELIMEITRMFCLTEMPEQSAYLMTFYDNISNALEDTLSITTLLDYWDERLNRKSIPGGEVKGVKIMTIHRSKGLQWKTVFIPFCDWKIHEAHNQTSNILWCSCDKNPLLCGLPMAAITATKMAAASAFSDKYMDELRNQRTDNLNLLYVATTRAKENLFMWGKRAKSDDNLTNPSIMHLITKTIDRLPCHPVGNIQKNDEEIRYRYGSLPRAYENSGKEESSDESMPYTNNPNRLDVRYITTVLTPRLYPALMNFRQSNASCKFTGYTDDETPPDTTSKYINIGTVLHAIFSAIVTTDDIDRVVMNLPASMTHTDDGQDLRAKARQLLERGCHNPLVADWFSGRYEVLNECAIIERQPDTGKVIERRTDRVMVSDKRIIVVDFKFGNAKSEHAEQVADYMRLLAGMYRGKSIKGFLWYVYDNRVDEVIP